MRHLDEEVLETQEEVASEQYKVCTNRLMAALESGTFKQERLVFDTVSMLRES